MKLILKSSPNLQRRGGDFKRLTGNPMDNSHLFERAKEMRRNPTEAEALGLLEISKLDISLDNNILLILYK
jgi:hypothetical protein